MDRVRLQQISVLRRWKAYRAIAESAQKSGEDAVFLADIVKKIGVSERLVRSDFDLMAVSIEGESIKTDSFYYRLGRYQTFLDQQTDVLIAASGLLGRTVLSAPDFAGPGVKTLGIFTPSAEEIVSLSGIPCYPMDRIEPLTRQLKIKVGIICVPKEEAQPIADAMVRGGITGIWNWSSADLDVPESVAVLREDQLETP